MDTVIEDEPILEEEYESIAHNKPLRGQDMLLGDTRDASAFPEWSLDDLFGEEPEEEEVQVPSDQELASMVEEVIQEEIETIPEEELILDKVAEPSLDDLVTTIEQQKEEEEQEYARLQREIDEKLKREQEEAEKLAQQQANSSQDELSQLLGRLNVSDDNIKRMSGALDNDISSDDFEHTMNPEIANILSNQPSFDNSTEEAAGEIKFEMDPNFVEADLAPEPMPRVKREPIYKSLKTLSNSKPVESFEISSEPVFIMPEEVMTDTKPENVLPVEEVEKPENELEVDVIEAAENDLAVEEVIEEDDSTIHFAMDETEADTTSIELPEKEEPLFRNISVSASDPIIQSAPITASNTVVESVPTEAVLPDYEEIDNIDAFVKETENAISEAGITLVDEPEEEIVVIEDSAEKEVTPLEDDMFFGLSSDMEVDHTYDQSTDETERKEDVGFELDIDMLTSGVTQIQHPVTQEVEEVSDDEDEFALSIDDLTNM